jgi:UDP-N-acetylglucosamine--N-acetylmuramyl-(pentapeptide) pyrophosphoryl-undecaprenol N-acetylglucosamine transferase
MIKMIFAGGGTGGHIFPAIAMANEIRKRYPDAQIVFVGTKKGLETEVVPKFGFKIYFISVRGIKRKLNLKLFLFPYNLAKSLFQSNLILKNINPDAVVGTGGYVSWPLVFLAALKSIPTAIQEQNSYPGVSTRLLSFFVDKVFIAYPDSIKYFLKKSNLEFVGNPVRENIFTGEKDLALKEFGLEQKKKTLFIFGGSQGSKVINQAILDGLDILAKQKDLQIIWQTGKDDFSRIKNITKPREINLRIFPFIDDMRKPYAVCDLIVSRSGALTLAEILCCAKPSILIPYPFAAADHQRYNAEFLKKSGATYVILQKNLNGEKLANLVLDLLNNASKLEKMKKAAEKLAQPQATSVLVDRIIDLSRIKSKKK